MSSFLNNDCAHAWDEAPGAERAGWGGMERQQRPWVGVCNPLPRSTKQPCPRMQPHAHLTKSSCDAHTESASVLDAKHRMAWSSLHFASCLRAWKTSLRCTAGTIMADCPRGGRTKPQGTARRSPPLHPATAAMGTALLDPLLRAR